MVRKNDVEFHGPRVTPSFGLKMWARTFPVSDPSDGFQVSALIFLAYHVLNARPVSRLDDIL